MSVKQISVFVENKKGKLAEITRYIANNNVNVRSLSIADTPDFGILRIICENTGEAEEALKNGGYITTITEVLAVQMSDKPGSIAEILEVLSEADIAVEYTYAFISAKGEAYLIFRVDDNQSAAAVLAGAGFKTAGQKELF